jgi:hypothetical protein
MNSFSNNSLLFSYENIYIEADNIIKNIKIFLIILSVTFLYFKISISDNDSCSYEKLT